jgi:hypothetical protein
MVHDPHRLGFPGLELMPDRVSTRDPSRLAKHADVEGLVPHCEMTTPMQPRGVGRAPTGASDHNHIWLRLQCCTGPLRAARITE